MRSGGATSVGSSGVRVICTPQRTPRSRRSTVIILGKYHSGKRKVGGGMGCGDRESSGKRLGLQKAAD